jgi:7-methyl-GTP pyrophosphatase
MTKLILASTSPWRRELLGRLGLPFTWVAPGVDEGPLQALSLAPEELASRLARAKAEAVAAEHPQAVVIGSDQVCALGERSFGKPGSPEAAVERLLALAGKRHRLVTAVCLVRGQQRREFVDVTQLVVRDLTREQARRYVEHDDTAQVAGGYKLEGRGIALFESIESADHTAIIGLPLMRLARELEALGVTVL